MGDGVVRAGVAVLGAAEQTAAVAPEVARVERDRGVVCDDMRK